MAESLTRNPDKGPENENFMVTPIVYIILTREDKILLMKRGRGRYDEYWSLPAGHIDEGDSARQTTVKEAQEVVRYKY